MRIVIFGASGGTGRELIAQALTARHEVTAFARNPARLAVDGVRVVQGDVVNAAEVGRAIKGQDAVLSALGAATPFRRDPTLVLGVRHIIEAMQASGVRRLVYLSFLGVREGRLQLGALGRYVVAPLLLRHPVADHALKEELIEASGLDWIIVRPPRLTNGPRTGRYRHGTHIHATSMVPRISRADVAEFMLRQLVDDSYLRQAPAVMG